MKTAALLPADPEHGFKCVTVKGFCVVCDRSTRWRWHNKAYCAEHIPSEKYRNRRSNRMESTALQTMDKQGMLARIEQAKFPQNLTPQDKAVLAEVATSYGLDPLMGELMIYQGRPYVSIDARYRKAQESGALAGVETRPATKEEREAWDIPDDDYFFRSEVFRKGVARPFVGWGRVLAKESTKKDGFRPIEVNPQRMAEKRAEAQALRKGFNLPLPSLEGETHDPFVEGEFRQAPVELPPEQPQAPTPPVDADPPPEPHERGSSGAIEGDTEAEKDMRDLIREKTGAQNWRQGTVPSWCAQWGADCIDEIPRDKLEAALAWFKGK